MAIRVLLQRKEIEEKGVAITEKDALSDTFHDFFRLSPSSARFYKVNLDDDAVPDQADLERLVADKVLVKIRIQN